MSNVGHLDFNLLCINADRQVFASKTYATRTLQENKIVNPD